MEALRKRLAEATDPASQARLRRIIAQQERNARNRQAWDEDRDLPESPGQKRKRDDGKERPREQIFADIESDLREEEARQKREAELRRCAEARRQSEAEKRRIEADRRAQFREKLRRERERREREQRRSNQTYPPIPRVLQPAVAIPLQSITDWRQHVALAFTNYSAMQIFPSPPASPCGKPECHLTRELRTLEACKCNIQACIRRAGIVSKAQLKSERLKWHPDRFAACPEDRREQFAKMGREVFVVVDGMFQGEEGGRCAGFDGK
ncbi:hypothetical protein CKM354_000653300 [Cercospora kikuchii]|uniref:Uncharacterized protein n=1 Tax=Cercospora kikuchii TaxID=84275 RepID=A0A9P3CIC5_9PEZI|nr:uncharacterized protein CKM354_000653300 [Cercospora kikuchii]GIZ43301.1 hypothetical protein CKM354_000653300 [Cercospora kikuchii]